MGGPVVLISSSIVQPGNSDQSGQTKIHLTPFDLSLLQIDCPQRVLGKLSNIDEMKMVLDN